MVDCTTATGSRWVTTMVASGNVVMSGPMFSRCWGHLSTHRSRGWYHWRICSTVFMYA